MIDGYQKLSPGHWYQKELTGNLPNYSASYSKNSYDTYSTNDVMSKLRYDLICNNIGQFHSICDFGYGNGSFMKYCHTQNKTVFGYDISDYPVPEGTTKIDDPKNYNFDLITFFDSLEHLPQENLILFLKQLKTKNICVSVPWFHESLGSHWFINWKHRRENEHLHHFDSNGLINLLIQTGYKIKYVGNEEDKVRIPVDNYPNILTVIGSKID